MGSPAQQPVYYDSEQGQYFTMNNTQNNSSSPANVFQTIFGGLAPVDSPYYQAQIANRNYLGSPYKKMQQFVVPEYNYMPYEQLTNVLPELNTSQSASSLLAPTDSALLGAGRFVNTNTQGR